MATEQKHDNIGQVELGQVRRWVGAVERQMCIAGDDEMPDEVRDNASIMIVRALNRALQSMPERYHNS